MEVCDSPNQVMVQDVLCSSLLMARVGGSQFINPKIEEFLDEGSFVSRHCTLGHNLRGPGSTGGSTSALVVFPYSLLVGLGMKMFGEF